MDVPSDGEVHTHNGPDGFVAGHETVEESI